MRSVRARDIVATSARILLLVHPDDHQPGGTDQGAHAWNSESEERGSAQDAGALAYRVPPRVRPVRGGVAARYLLLGEDAEAVHRLRCEHRDGEDRDQADVGGGPVL